MDTPPTTRGRVDKAPFQFGLASLLLFTMWIAIGASLLRTFGIIMAPALFGVCGAVAGFQMSVIFRRVRVFDVLVAYFLACILGVIVVETVVSQTRWKGDFDENPAQFNFNILLSIIGVAIPTTIVGIWQLGKARKRITARMPTTCPSCGEEIRPMESIDSGPDYAFCRKCNQLFEYARRSEIWEKTDIQPDWMQRLHELASKSKSESQSKMTKHDSAQ